MKKYYELQLNAPAHRVWQIMGEDFGGIAKWASLLSHSSLDGEPKEGGVRICIIDGKESREVITQYDPDNFKFAYRALSGVPNWVTKAENHWSIVPVDEEKCYLISEPVFEVKWWISPFLPLISLGLGRLIKRVFEELKVWVETGEIHPRKLAALQSGSRSP